MKADGIHTKTEENLLVDFLPEKCETVEGVLQGFEFGRVAGVFAVFFLQSYHKLGKCVTIVCVADLG